MKLELALCRVVWSTIIFTVKFLHVHNSSITPPPPTPSLFGIEDDTSKAYHGETNYCKLVSSTLSNAHK